MESNHPVNTVQRETIEKSIDFFIMQRMQSLKEKRNRKDLKRKVK